MTQKRMKSVRGTLANREAPKMSPKAAMMKQKISTTKENQINDSKKFNLSRCQQKKKKKSNADTTKANWIISDSEKFKLSRCQQQKKKKKKSVHTCKEKSAMEMDIVPHSQDLMREILSWLPVPSLFRFKCVAKSWDITSDPYFRMKHQSHHVNSLRFLVVHSNLTKPPYHDNLYSTSSLSSPDGVQKIDYLSSDNNPRFLLLCGSCDGLVLIRVATSSSHHLLLWNPSTRESIQLPFPVFGIKNSTFGLGYDPTTDDYKILAIHNGKSQIHCGILALKSGCNWRNVYMDAPRMFITLRTRFAFVNPLAFVHGAFHWMPFSFCVVSFNISNEVYTKIPFSEQMHSHLSHSNPGTGDFHVSVLGGMLCFTSACEFYQANNIILWAMKEYGVKESWTQLFKVKFARHTRPIPIYRFADGDVLFHCRNGVSDSLRTLKGRRFRLWCDSLVHPQDMRQIISFNESLIDPKLLI